MSSPPAPSLTAPFPRYPLTFPHPSPIHALPRLSALLSPSSSTSPASNSTPDSLHSAKSPTAPTPLVNLFAKREDSNSGLAFGGNKTRKLEFLIPDAIAQGCDTLVSIGGIQSNQTRQVAAVAAKIGMRCVLVQEDWVGWRNGDVAGAGAGVNGGEAPMKKNDGENEKTPRGKPSDGVYDQVGNIQMSRILGADVRLDEAGFDIGMRPSFQRALEEVRETGGRPFAIPAGCSEHEKGGLGFVRFAEEVRMQEREMGVFFDYVVVCAVTGSTLAGMIVGFKGDMGRRVIGIDASAKPGQTREQVLRIARKTAQLVGLKDEIGEEDVVLDERFGGPEYGIPNEGTLEAIRLCARSEGMLTDPVYEGKSMHGMIEMVKNGEFEDGKNVLYVHLGGVPALNAYKDLFKDG